MERQNFDAFISFYKRYTHVKTK